MEPMGLTAYALAKAVGVDQTRISQLIKGECRIPLIQLRLSQCFNMSAEFWLNAQIGYDLEEEGKHKKYDL